MKGLWGGVGEVPEEFFMPRHVNQEAEVEESQLVAEGLDSQKQNPLQPSCKMILYPPVGESLISVLQSSCSHMGK